MIGVILIGAWLILQSHCGVIIDKEGKLTKAFFADHVPRKANFENNLLGLGRSSLIGAKLEDRDLFEYPREIKRIAEDTNYFNFERPGLKRDKYYKYSKNENEVSSDVKPGLKTGGNALTQKPEAQSNDYISRVFGGNTNIVRPGRDYIPPRMRSYDFIRLGKRLSVQTISNLVQAWESLKLRLGLGGKANPEKIEKYCRMVLPGEDAEGKAEVSGEDLGEICPDYLFIRIGRPFPSPEILLRA